MPQIPSRAFLDPSWFSTCLLQVLVFEPCLAITSQLKKPYLQHYWLKAIPYTNLIWLTTAWQHPSTKAYFPSQTPSSTVNGKTSANWKKRSLKTNMWRQLRTSASIQNSSLLFGLEIIFLSRIGWAMHLASGIAVVLFLNQRGMIRML